MKYTYTAIFNPIEDGSGYYCRVPDLPGCISTGSSIDDSIDQILDAASIWLVGAEDDRAPIPAASPQHQFSVEPGGFFSVIQIDTLKYREKIDNRAVRKNVSIPAWMSHLADRKHINCSQVLQDGLRAIFESD